MAMAKQNLGRDPHGNGRSHAQANVGFRWLNIALKVELCGHGQHGHGRILINDTAKQQSPASSW
jgi:hypothetical protein